jgi:RNA-directed DNA polymerase
MLNIQKIEHMARILGTSPSRLMAVADAADSYYENLVLLDPARPDKSREVVNVMGDLRRLQSLLHTNLLKPRHKPSIFSHGGIQGRHIRSNAEAHQASVFVFKTDVENFYPSISHHRVYRLFSGAFGCSPDVARVCTRLCTYRWRLSLGLITSPILADCLMKPVDIRIGAMCKKHELIYTRFVDDITLSARFPVESGSFMKIEDRHGDPQGARFLC